MAMGYKKFANILVNKLTLAKSRFHSKQTPERWADTEKIVLRPEPPGGLKDPTLGIVGVGSAVPSKRCDVVVVDDIVTALNAYSPIQRAKIASFVFQTLFPTVVPAGKRIVVGSLWDPRDLYHEYAERLEIALPTPEPLILDSA